MLLGQFIIIIAFSVLLCVSVQCACQSSLHSVYCVFTMFGVKLLYFSSQTWWYCHFHLANFTLEYCHFHSSCIASESFSWYCVHDINSFCLMTRVVNQTIFNNVVWLFDFHSMGRVHYTILQEKDTLVLSEYLWEMEHHCQCKIKWVLLLLNGCNLPAHRIWNNDVCVFYK